MIDAPEEILRRAQAFLNNAEVRNLHAQAHARAILRNVARPSDDWPRFRSDLDERLHHAAHYLLWAALHLLEAGRSHPDVGPLLLVASEALEFLCADPRQSTPVRLEQAVTAGFGYYLAGHYARSYVLLKEAVPQDTPLPAPIALFMSVLRKQFGVARRITVANFSLDTLSDEIIAQALSEGRLSEDEAYERILLASATQAVSNYLEYPKTGSRTLLDAAISILDDAILIAKEQRYVDWWWWLFCLRYGFAQKCQFPGTNRTARRVSGTRPVSNRHFCAKPCATSSENWETRALGPNSGRCRAERTGPSSRSTSAPACETNPRSSSFGHPSLTRCPPLLPPTGVTFA